MSRKKGRCHGRGPTLVWSCNPRGKCDRSQHRGYQVRIRTSYLASANHKGASDHSQEWH